MFYELMAAFAASPATGDQFPVKLLLIIAAAAVIIGIITAVIGKKKNKDE
ncbi:LPXTG cell wall anchor domain-containing protein [Ruminococcus sp. XPD3002]|nr:LPXTG cell wall anchor domain-containing protein [Ruminococcus sp.]MBR6983804.1 LPXTG cell wall anchor domain-containing protein [Ruminococcus sp.]SFX31635.1 LPXTG-motif cell wall anchor domain-containing protein [Ruminococcus flavefaciens]